MRYALEIVAWLVVTALIIIGVVMVVSGLR